MNCSLGLAANGTAPTRFDKTGLYIKWQAIFEGSVTDSNAAIADGHERPVAGSPLHCPSPQCLLHLEAVTSQHYCQRRYAN